MKVGDRVKILKTGKIGIIIGETAISWKIDFLDGNKPVLVKKGTPMEVLTITPNPNPSPNPRPEKKLGWKRILWTIGVILFIAVAIFITLKNVL